MFIDYAKVKIRSGDGGNGCISFRREKFVPRGGPNGGDGGKGGDVIFKGNVNISTLLDFRYNKIFKGGRGTHGMGGDKTGKNGKDEIVMVPPGSVIKNALTGETIGEILNDGEELLVAKGGIGGKGNAHFKSATNQAPRFAQPGEKGIELEIEIELKLIADVGLVGFPNAGKSTLIANISAAKPKIADYPFTTLVPNLGIVRYGDYDSFVVADIPGIIEGASSGKGLGLQFLRHIERTRILVFLIDALNIESGKVKNPLDEYLILVNELERYDVNLTQKPRLICFTKYDAINETTKKLISKIETNVPAIGISSVSGYNINKLKDLIWKLLIKTKVEDNEIKSNQ
ncbi:MAG: GTPase ObgE [Ignavibacteriaceae bacterium]|jgi:Obg family GTPase CgtA|nr:MAG: GTP-binding protein [Chlorobi bacterium OLB4]MBW7854637.1 GTPase ObgE [Ignavibacteria bacterium]MEB2330550.1 GTPase ObgE [Ignavibacteriaceae bacterium]OQY78157.1 MAG: GTPase ObgE [Ignavibacteriales bacterium UTCHB1]